MSQRSRRRRRRASRRGRRLGSGSFVRLRNAEIHPATIKRHQAERPQENGAGFLVRDEPVDRPERQPEDAEPDHQPKHGPHGAASGWCRSNAGRSERIGGNDGRSCARAAARTSPTRASSRPTGRRPRARGAGATAHTSTRNSRTPSAHHDRPRRSRRGWASRTPGRAGSRRPSAACPRSADHELRPERQVEARRTAARTPSVRATRAAGRRSPSGTRSRSPRRPRTTDPPISV